MLSYNDRKIVRELELTHGVIINPVKEGGLTARRWRTDELVAETDSTKEMGVVLRSMMVYPEADELEPPHD